MLWPHLITLRGYNSLTANTTGANNTGIGESQYGNTTASNNTAVGLIMNVNTTGVTILFRNQQFRQHNRKL